MFNLAHKLTSIDFKEYVFSSYEISCFLLMYDYGFVYQSLSLQGSLQIDDYICLAPTSVKGSTFSFQ